LQNISSLFVERLFPANVNKSYCIVVDTILYVSKENANYVKPIKGVECYAGPDGSFSLGMSKENSPNTKETLNDPGYVRAKRCS